MAGGICSDEKCPLCGGNLNLNTGKALICPDHPQCAATGRFRVWFKGLIKRFGSYQEANRFLTALQYKSDEGTFDPRDYRSDRPLGFENLAEAWLRKKKEKLRCFRNPRNHMRYACQYFANRNIKDIGYGELEDFFDQLPAHLSNKTKHNIKTTLHSFWVWLIKRNARNKIPIPMPEFPAIDYELAWRKTIDKATQWAVLDEVRRITYDINPKIYTGCLWLTTYLNIRPIELIHVREDDFDLINGIVYIRHNKEQRPKKAYLLDEDIALIKSLRPAHPHPTFYGQYFFRHGKRKGISDKTRSQFGKDYLYKWWRRACQNLNIEGVPLYPGTRHSSVIDLGQEYSPEEIMGDGTGHKTNKAFYRYFRLRADKRRAISAQARNRGPSEITTIHKENGVA